MVHLANLNGVADTFRAIPKVTNKPKTQKRAKIISLLGKKQADYQELPPLTTRRLALGLATASLIANSYSNGVSFAQDNGLWLDYPFPLPSVENNIANEKTGTRSFLKNGIYMAKIDTKSMKYRLKKYAFDLLAMEDLIGPDTLNYVRKYLRLKSTFMYYDFDKVISATPVSDKQPLIDLANRLFDNFEKLEDASKRKNLPETESSYQDTKVILQEVMNRMA